MKSRLSPFVNKRRKTIEFHISISCASHISLVGSFNDWAKDEILLRKRKNDIWKVEIPMLPEGRYQYKFFIDDRMPMEDIENPNREPDGVTGWNSVLTV